MPRLVERGSFLVTPGCFDRTIALPGGERELGGAELIWQLRIGDAVAAAGRHQVRIAGGDERHVRISVPLPDIAEPAGMVLEVDIERGGRKPLRAVFPFTLYPQETGRAIASLFGQAVISLYDPDDGVREAIETLGMKVVPAGAHADLRGAETDLIVIGPGGFSRGDEALGPILEARARGGTPILILDQPSLPATLTDRLRLWPTFRCGADPDYLLASGHPALRGPSGSQGAAYLASGATLRRPFLPPTRGNFRVLAGMRVRRGAAWQEGVGIVEFPIGQGTVVAAQISLGSDYHRDARARMLLINLLAYLLDDYPQLQRSFLYGAGDEVLPACIADLAPDAPIAPIDLQDVDLLLVPAGWQAPRRRDAAALAPLADVARFLHDGGTVVLIDPQPLVADYLSAILGERVEFEPIARSIHGAGGAVVDEGLPLLQGIAAADLELLARPGEREFLLRSHRPTDRLRPLLKVSGLSFYQVGEGALVALAMPQAVDCRSPRAASLLARLFTNLGISLDAPRHGDTPRITHLDR
jgi:hypothetical protein